MIFVIKNNNYIFAFVNIKIKIMENFKKNLVCEQDGNKLFILEEGCNLIDGVSIKDIKKMFPKFEIQLDTMINRYIIEKSDGEMLYE